MAGGFSLNNQFGNAIFRNDFILAGTNGDVAGIKAGGATNNIAQAFADMAAAGAAGNLTFESRGGTNNAPGTTVEEHQLWALIDSSASDAGDRQPVSGVCGRRRWRDADHPRGSVTQVTNNGNANCPDFRNRPRR